MTGIVGEAAFFNALISKLRTDTGANGLVTLTGHTIKDLRIGRHMPNNTTKPKYLGVWNFRHVPLIEGGYVGFYQKTRVRFYCSAKNSTEGELTIITMADRLDNLLMPEQLSSNSANRSYYDFSDNVIKVSSVTRAARVGSRFDDRTDTWTLWIDAKVIWKNSPCPSELE